MRPRRAEAALTWNGAAVTTDMIGSKGVVTYTDPADGESDTIDIEINDRDAQWAGDWLPQKGDTLTARILIYDWDAEGDDRSFDCGSFTLDDYSFSGWPRTGTISGVSVPADTSFKSTSRTKTWEKATLQAIGQEIASRAGISLVWDVEGGDVPIETVEQTEQTDCDFYTQLCGTYGLCLKLYAQKLVVYDREAYKAKEPVDTIRREDIQTWNWHTKLEGTYTGGEYTYTEPNSEEEIKATIGGGDRILKKSGKADNAADARRKITALVNKANHGATTLTVTIQGRPGLVATQCVTVEGMGGAIDGKYYIDSAASKIGSGYTMDLELSKVEGGSL